MCNCVIVTFVQVTFGELNVELCNCDICTGYRLCVNVELCNCDICTGYSWCAEYGIV